MKMVIGLGNPGKQYEQTRHNIGFMVVDALAQSYQLTFKLDKTMQAEIAQANINGDKVLFVKPFTFMNESGRSVQALKAYYRVPEENILVIYDDLDLTLGKVRLRAQGSAGGHNGIKSLMNVAKMQRFPRVKVGIGRPKDRQSVVNHVLGRFSKQEQQTLQLPMQKAEQAVEAWLNDMSFERVMNQYN